MRLEVTSPAFKEGDCIPQQYTCEGSDISPPLEWTNVPEGTESFVVICADPDAEGDHFIHWLLYDIPQNVTRLGEGVPNDEVLPNGAKHGRNDAGNIGYTGPCPPSGEHRYYFFVYALSQPIKLNPCATNAELKNAMQNIVLAKGNTMGRYRSVESPSEIVDEIAEQARESG